MRLFTKDARNENQRERLRKRSGFTLVELLTVIAIIGMLGAISITTVRGAVQSAKESQTRTTVAKLDSVVTGIYEKYQYRRVEVNSGGSAKQRAYSRVLKLRDLLRCDMPCTWEEASVVSTYNQDGTSRFTPLQEVYLREVNLALSSFSDDEKTKKLENINSELLYLVVMNADPEARSTFSDREVADTDNDGLLEFVDGWGRPIRWMRWAPGLQDSDRQPRCYEGNKKASKKDADPFDPLNVIQLALDKPFTVDSVAGAGWFLVPYIYSAGSDGEYGLITPDYIESTAGYGDTSFMNDPFTRSRGNSADTAGSPDGSFHKDNIDNHTLVR